jgi:hypothetical protein
MERIGHSPDYTGLFGDKRLSRRAELLAQSLLIGKTSSVHGSTQSESEQKGFYRFLSNERVTEGELIAELTQRCSANASRRHVIVIQDSSSIGLSEHARHIKKGSGVGLVGNKTGLGFLTHISLVLDAENETMLGFCDVQLWHRTRDKANNTSNIYKRESIDQKESYKWIKASQQSQQCLQNADSITIIQDREGDIYEQFCMVAGPRTHLIVRSRDNRKLADGSKLYDSLAQAPVLGHYDIEVLADLRKGKIGRTATVAVRCQAVGIQKPQGAQTKDIPNSLVLYAVEVKEINPTTNHPICWRLLTTEKVTTYQQAIVIINRYKQRWYIEQLFRLLKKQGYRIEDSQLESGWGIRKLFVLVLNAALRVIQLYMAYGEEQSQPIGEVFNEQEIHCMEVIEKSLLIQTDKTTNPFTKEKLAWASWVIARLGGWKGNNKQRAAGPIILKKGLEKFEIMYQGWRLAQNTT